jgi:hypothetical protein
VVVALLGMVVPAFGGPSAISVAKKALKVANKANKKSSKAVLLATKGPKNESITSAKIANLTIKNEDISAGAVGSGEIANGAISSVDVGDGQITNGAVTAADIAGADIHGSIHGDAGAVAMHECTTAAIDLGGAQVGDVAFFSFTGDTPAPQGLTFQILKITSPNEGTMRFCNPTNSSSPAFSGVGIRVLTFR